MSGLIRATEPAMVRERGRSRPDYADDPRFTAAWWTKHTSFGPPDHEWRSYVRDGEEVARALLSMRFPSHADVPAASALLIWSFEVRADLRCSGDHIGTRIVEQLVDEFPDREIYVGPTFESWSFWNRFGWPMCECEECDGRDLIVRRP